MTDACLRCVFISADYSVVRIRRSMCFLISTNALIDCPAPSLPRMHVFHFGNYYPPVKFSVTELSFCQRIQYLEFSSNSQPLFGEFFQQFSSVTRVTVQSLSGMLLKLNRRKRGNYRSLIHAFTLDSSSCQDLSTPWSAIKFCRRGFNAV